MSNTIQVKIRVFVPKEVMSVSAVVRNIEHTMIQKTQQDLRREFQKTVSTWDHKPNWTLEHYFGVRVLWVKVFTYSTQYRLVNVGTTKKNYPIVPRRARMLRFQSGFRPKTRARIIGSFAGGKFGPYTSRHAVIHPGFEGREFDKTIAEEYQDEFARDIQDAIKDALP